MKEEIRSDSEYTSVFTYGLTMAAFAVSGVALIAFFAYWIRKACRHIGRYEYTALEAEGNSHELERKSRERAHSACLQYLKFCPRYALVQHLNDIGSRVDKHWFVVKDSSVKTERLLTLTPRSIQCVINNDSETRKSIMDLFLALHTFISIRFGVSHGYISSDPTYGSRDRLPFGTHSFLSDLEFLTDI
ncbi:slowpoke-binding protein-like [Diaphorina citri]|uniref:Slowpoke-binding protein-like n=1 Tax=Diaphorina citri TaxID=121845 RepID=A0A1S4EF07_DIACI|nr:slowpoke-binding protein-like [Diaphorina citri]